jgi:hypothetical protein
MKRIKTPYFLRQIGKLEKKYRHLSIFEMGSIKFVGIYMLLINTPTTPRIEKQNLKFLFMYNKYESVLSYTESTL